MEREAFRQRMQQYKQARENNPQLKYWDWKKYADGGEVRDNTYVAPVYKEQVFIPATGAQKIKNDYQYKYGSKSPYKGGELEIVSPEFDILTGVRGLINSIPSNTLRPTTDVTDYINDQFIQRQMSFGKNSGKVIHADYGDLHSGFTKGTTGARVTDKGLVPGHNPNTDIDYSWWNADKPYSYSINNNKFTRYMSGNESDIPGIITVREQTYPIGQWNGKSGFVLKTEKVTPQVVPMDNIDTFQYDPILKTYSRVKYKSYKDGGTIDEDPPQNTSERPITNFDPKGDPYNPTYGYNPGAGYVSNSDPLGSLYIEGALLNPVFKLAGNVVSNVARGLTKYSSKYVPEVRRTVQDKINSLFRREAEDKARTYKLYDDAIESRNRIIEDLYSNPAYMERARQIQNTYGDDYAKVYEDIINQYNTNYWNLPNPVIKQLDAKAKMQAKDAAVNRYITRRQPAGYDDFEYQINRNLTEIDYPTTRHELGHYVDFNLAKSSNPDYSNSMFAELKRDLSKQKNPLFPDKTDYYSKGTEQKSYMNTLREYMFKNGMINNIGDKVTSRQIKKAIRSLPKDMRSIEAAYLQFATPGQYIKWFNKIPLLGTYPIVNKQFQNYEEDKDKAREQR